MCIILANISWRFFEPKWCKKKWCVQLFPLQFRKSYIYQWSITNRICVFFIISCIYNTILYCKYKTLRLRVNIWFLKPCMRSLIIIIIVIVIIIKLYRVILKVVQIFKAVIEPHKSYVMLIFFEKKGLKVFQKKLWATQFYEKMCKKKSNQTIQVPKFLEYLFFSALHSLG
jgi:hypothetical protein